MANQVKSSQVRADVEAQTSVSTPLSHIEQGFSGTKTRKATWGWAKADSSQLGFRGGNGEGGW
jgi:hypothetical protein